MSVVLDAHQRRTLRRFAGWLGTGWLPASDDQHRPLCAKCAPLAVRLGGGVMLPLPPCGGGWRAPDEESRFVLVVVLHLHVVDDHKSAPVAAAVVIRSTRVEPKATTIKTFVGRRLPSPKGKALSSGLLNAD